MARWCCLFKSLGAGRGRGESQRMRARACTHTHTHTHTRTYAQPRTPVSLPPAPDVGVCAHSVTPGAPSNSRTHTAMDTGAILTQKQAPTSARTHTGTPARTPTYTVPRTLSVHTHSLLLGYTPSPAPSPSCTQTHSHFLGLPGQAPLCPRSGQFQGDAPPAHHVPDPLSTHARRGPSRGLSGKAQYWGACIAPQLLSSHLPTGHPSLPRA